jgi:hypothetical protein
MAIPVIFVFKEAGQPNQEMAQRLEDQNSTTMTAASSSFSSPLMLRASKR